MVKWSLTAKNDLKQIYTYIFQDSSFYAKQVMEEIIRKSETLNLYPNMGKITPELNDSAIRELIIYSYRMIYEVSNNEVQILTLVHSRKNFNPKTRQDL